MAVAPDDSFPRPASFGPGSVWADRSGHRSLVGRNQRGVEIPIGHGEGEINPGELLKLALIGCAGMSSDITLTRRLGEDFEMRLWAHGTSDEEDNRYHRIAEEVQLPLDGLTNRKSTRLNSSHVAISYAVFCLKKKKYPLPEYKNRNVTRNRCH